MQQPRKQNQFETLLMIFIWFFPDFLLPNSRAVCTWSSWDDVRPTARWLSSCQHRTTPPQMTRKCNSSSGGFGQFLGDLPAAAAAWSATMCYDLLRVQKKCLQSACEWFSSNNVWICLNGFCISLPTCGDIQMINICIIVYCRYCIIYCTQFFLGRNHKFGTKLRKPNTSAHPRISSDTKGRKSSKWVLSLAGSRVPGCRYGFFLGNSEQLPDPEIETQSLRLGTATVWEIITLLSFLCWSNTCLLLIKSLSSTA